MRPDHIRELLERNPFIPFRIQLSSGDQIDITQRHSVAVMRMEIFVVLPDDRWKFISLRQIASIETLQAA
ncbi:MAG TPA: hypothetical protein VN541_17440 [Tepidisphaeraceae bacterium]|nr:hypothetical protein [Tepidisphaeraceae bacterium]